MKTAFKDIFIKKFHDDPVLVKSPGRLNLLGEHTDYNEGFVLPASIDKSIQVAIGKRDDDFIHLYSVEYKEEQIVSLQCLRSSSKHWALYVLGVVDQLQKNDYEVSGFNMVFDGDVPIGAGMSSSAALECASIFALNELFKLGISRMDMVKMAQQAEHEFAGVKCGIMDQFASMFGKAGHVIRLDCRSLAYEYFPFETKDIKILLLNTNVKHSLASSAYNQRREQCETGVRLIQQHLPEVKSLRDATLQMLHQFVDDPLVRKRCEYVVEENDRLEQACVDLEHGDMNAFGSKMFATHDGLSKKYEVSCKELDWLVEKVRNNPNVIGARMMGGGFGGCTINLIKENTIDELVALLQPAYEKEMNLPLTYYIASIKNGTALLS